MNSLCATHMLSGIRNADRGDNSCHASSIADVAPSRSWQRSTSLAARTPNPCTCQAMSLRTRTITAVRTIVPNGCEPSCHGPVSVLNISYRRPSRVGRPHLPRLSSASAGRRAGAEVRGEWMNVDVRFAASVGSHNRVSRARLVAPTASPLPSPARAVPAIDASCSDRTNPSAAIACLLLLLLLRDTRWDSCMFPPGCCRAGAARSAQLQVARSRPRRLPLAPRWPPHRPRNTKAHHAHPRR